MPTEVQGKTFYNITEVSEVADVTRQSIWRWRRDEKVPSGRRFQGREVLFTLAEVEMIFKYAHRLEPNGSPQFGDQLALFE